MPAPSRIVAVAPGPPFAPQTFSGISTSLLGALRERGALAAAVDGRPRMLVRAEQAASFSPDAQAWRHWFNAGAGRGAPLWRRAQSEVAARRARRAAPNADVLLQLAGWYDPHVPGLVRCSYHDGNLATFLQRPDLRIDRDAPRVRRALRLERALYDRVDVIFVMSEWLRGSFVRDFGQSPEKVVVAGGGPAFEELPPERDAAAPDDPPRFLFVGKDFERKGGPTLLAAFARVREELPAAELVVVGPSRLESVPAGVRFLGRLERQALRPEFEQATAFVLPSVYEPFGIALLEAMAYELPCVAADTCAMPEIVADGETGHVVAPADANALADRLLALARDPQRARAMGRAGRARMLSRFTWARTADRILDALAARR